MKIKVPKGVFTAMLWKNNAGIPKEPFSEQFLKYIFFYLCEDHFKLTMNLFPLKSLCLVESFHACSSWNHANKKQKI